MMEKEILLFLSSAFTVESETLQFLSIIIVL